jgi:hypothetical protein
MTRRFIAAAALGNGKTYALKDERIVISKAPRQRGRPSSRCVASKEGRFPLSRPA